MRNIFKRIDDFYDNHKWFRIVFKVFEIVIFYLILMFAIIGLYVFKYYPFLNNDNNVEYDLSSNTSQIDYTLGSVTYVSYDTTVIDDEIFITVKDEFYIIDWMDYKTSWVGSNKMVLSLPKNDYITIKNVKYYDVDLIEIQGNSIYLIGNGLLIIKFNKSEILSTDYLSFHYQSSDDAYNIGYDQGFDEGLSYGYQQGILEVLSSNYLYDLDNAFMYKNDENFPNLPSDDYEYSALLFNTKKGQELGLPYAPLSSIMETEAYFKKIGDNYMPLVYIMTKSPLMKYQYTIIGDSISNVDMNNDTLYITLHYNKHYDLGAIEYYTSEINFYNYEGNLYNTLSLVELKASTGDSSTFTIQVTQTLDDALGDYWLNGYYEGLANGEGKGYKKGYDKGLEIGRKQGYNEGLNANPNNHWSDLLFTIFGAFGTILGIEILPGWSIGIIIGIPIVFGIIYFIIGRKKD